MHRKILEEMLAVYADDESFKTVVNMAINKTVMECVKLIDSYVVQGVPPQEFATKLIHDTNVVTWTQNET